MPFRIRYFSSRIFFSCSLSRNFFCMSMTYSPNSFSRPSKSMSCGRVRKPASRPTRCSTVTLAEPSRGVTFTGLILNRLSISSMYLAFVAFLATCVGVGIVASFDVVLDLGGRRPAVLEPVPDQPHVTVDPVVHVVQLVLQDLAQHEHLAEDRLVDARLGLLLLHHFERLSHHGPPAGPLVGDFGEQTVQALPRTVALLGLVDRHLPRSFRDALVEAPAFFIPPALDSLQVDGRQLLRQEVVDDEVLVLLLPRAQLGEDPQAGLAIYVELQDFLGALEGDPGVFAQRSEE